MQSLLQLLNSTVIAGKQPQTIKKKKKSGCVPVKLIYESTLRADLAYRL